MQKWLHEGAMILGYMYLQLLRPINSLGSNRANWYGPIFGFSKLVNLREISVEA